MEAISWIWEHIGEIGAIVGILGALATAITGLTPTPKDDAWVRRILGWLSIVLPKDSPGTFKAPLTSVPQREEPLLVERLDSRR